jgi:uncharacterized small protein (DUF1192 family)
MNPDDLEPKPKADGFVRQELSRMGIAELEARIALLEGEIDRCRAEIAKRQSTRANADAFFKLTPGDGDPNR